MANATDITNLANTDKSMSKPITIEHLQDIIAVFNSRDVDHIASFFADDAVLNASHGTEWGGRLIRGRHAIADYMANRFEQVRNMRWEPVEDYVADERRGVSVWMIRGNEANGNTIETLGVDLWEFRGDKIVCQDTYWKNRTSCDQPQVDQPQGVWGERDTQLQRRTNWAWVATGRYHDWMDSHAPFAQFE